MWHKIQDFPSPIEGPMNAFSDDTYIVAMKMHESQMLGGVLHVIIWRIDAQEIAGWNEIQRIKNELLGPSAWAYEVYPGEDCRVEIANARHIWVINQLPFGYRFRATDVNEPKLREPAELAW